MGHIHPDVVIDGDSKRFVIDPVTRAIKNETQKLLLIKDDHNSERYTFELPRLVEGHDMSLCNKVEVHYINVNSNNRALPPNTGIYPIKDIATEIIDGVEKITGSWLISGNVTKHAGPLSFAVRFACVVDDVTVYSWNTLPHTGITISDGINNLEAAAEEYNDILQTWWNSLQAAFNARTISLVTSDGAAPDVCPDVIECNPDENITIDYVGIHVLAEYTTPNKYGQRTVMGAIVIGENGELSLNNCFYVEGQNGFDALVFKDILEYDVDPYEKKDWSAEYKYFNRRPEIGDIFRIIGIRPNNDIVELLCEITSMSDYVNYTIKNICNLTGQDALVYNSVWRHYSYDTPATVNSKHNVELGNFNRTPIVGDTFCVIGLLNSLDDVYKVLCKVTSVGNDVEFEIISVCCLMGKQGGSMFTTSAVYTDGAQLAISNLSPSSPSPQVGDSILWTSSGSIRMITELSGDYVRCGSIISTFKGADGPQGIPGEMEFFDLTVQASTDEDMKAPETCPSEVICNTTCFSDSTITVKTTHVGNFCLVMYWDPNSQGQQWAFGRITKVFGGSVTVKLYGYVVGPQGKEGKQGEKGEQGGFFEQIGVTLVYDGLGAGSGAFGAANNIPILQGAGRNDRATLSYSINGEEKTVDVYAGVADDDTIILTPIEAFDGMNIADCAIPLGDTGITLLVAGDRTQTHYMTVSMGDYTIDTMPTIKILGIEYVVKNYTTTTYVDNKITSLEEKIAALEARLAALEA